MIVTCKFLGRLCNNIFQVMAMIGYAKKYNVPWFLPRQYHHKDIFRFGLPLMRGPKRYKQHNELWNEDTAYQEIPFYPQGVELHGFFQSEKYFSNAKDEIHEAFHTINNSLMLTDNLSGVCSIHVRRGDYLEYPTRFCVPSIEYLGNAIDIIKSKGVHNFKVFSDDIKWCMENFKFSGNFEYSQNQDPKYDLQEMAHCEHNIICASTFGWIPAWLNKNENKTVIAPKQWFGPDTKLTDKDIIPETWIKI